MRRELEIAIDGLGTFRDRAAQMLMILRAQRRLWPAVVAVAALVVLLVTVAAVWAWCSDGPVAAADADRAWRYLLVCNGCGHREHPVEHPARTLAQQNGLFKCPACGEFKAAWHRRGSQAVPPGGWESGSRTPATHPAPQAGRDPP